MYLDCGEVYRRDELLSRRVMVGQERQETVFARACWVLGGGCLVRYECLREIEMVKLLQQYVSSNAVSCGREGKSREERRKEGCRIQV